MPLGFRLEGDQHRHLPVLQSWQMHSRRLPVQSFGGGQRCWRDQRAGNSCSCCCRGRRDQPHGESLPILFEGRLCVGGSLSFLTCDSRYRSKHTIRRSNFNRHCWSPRHRGDWVHGAMPLWSRFVGSECSVRTFRSGVASCAKSHCYWTERGCIRRARFENDVESWRHCLDSAQARQLRVCRL